MKAKPLVLVCLPWLLVPAGVDAQSFWRLPPSGPSISLEMDRPSSPDNTPVLRIRSPWPLTSAVFLGFRYPVSRWLTLATELPFAHVSGRDNTCVDAECLDFVHGTVLGNPYVGIEVGPPGGVVRLRLGGRWPLLKASHLDLRDRYDAWAADIGFTSEMVDRLEAFLPRVTSGQADVVTDLDVTRSFGVRAMAGVSLLYHPDAAGYIHYEQKYQLHVRLGAQARFSPGRATFGAGLFVRDRRTGVDDFLRKGERQSYELSTTAGYRFGDWDGRLALRLPFQGGDGPDLDFRTVTLLVEHPL